MPGAFQSFEAYLRPGFSNTKSIALQAIDAGWDVWIGNSRGGMFSEGDVHQVFDWQE